MKQKMTDCEFCKRCVQELPHDAKPEHVEQSICKNPTCNEKKRPLTGELCADCYLEKKWDEDYGNYDLIWADTKTDKFLEKHGFLGDCTNLKYKLAFEVLREQEKEWWWKTKRQLQESFLPINEDDFEQVQRGFTWNLDYDKMTGADYSADDCVNVAFALGE